MTRSGKLWTILAVLLALCLGSESLAGKGNGKGGGGGGGGGGKLAGVFYIDSAFLDNGTYLAEGPARMTPDRNKTLLDYTGVPRIGSTAVSHDLHAGKRIFLTTRNGVGTNPRGPNKILVATDENSIDSVDLTDETVDIHIANVTWGKDDSFVSFSAVVWDAAGDATGHIFRVSVSFGTDGLPSADAGPEAVITGTTFVGTGGALFPTVSAHSWSPDGTKLVYRERINSTTLNLVVDDGTTSTVVATNSNDDQLFYPQWSPAAGSERILYVVTDTIQLVDSDGSNAEQLVSVVTHFDSQGVAWSPNGAHVAFIRLEFIFHKGQTMTGGELYAIPATGGKVVNVTKGAGINAVFGWVD